MKKSAIELKKDDIIYSASGGKIYELLVTSTYIIDYYIEINHAHYFLLDSTIGFSRDSLSFNSFNSVRTDFSKDNFERKMSNYKEINNVLFIEKEQALHQAIKVTMDLIEEKRNFRNQLNNSLEETEKHLVDLNNQLSENS